jgi:nickel transport protein
LEIADMTGRILASLASAAFACAPALAHDVWLTPMPGGKAYALVFGHPGELEPYDPARVEETYVIDTTGKLKFPPPLVQDNKVVIPTGPDIALIALYYDHGFWTVGPDRKSVAAPKWKVPNHRTASHIRLFNKNLLAWTPALAAPVGLELEIVPLANPLRLKPGDRYPIQVLYKSKPLPQADVEVMGDTELYTTDASGKVEVPIQKSDFQYVFVSHVDPMKSSPNVDEVESSTNLIFRP